LDEHWSEPFCQLNAPTLETSEHYVKRIPAMTQIQSLERQAGGLYVEVPNQLPLVFPLKHTAVKAQIAGNVSRVEVTQTFENPFTTTLEATYVFPLPEEAAVDEMEIRLGDRTIKGTIKKRQEAQALYEQAKQQGQTAGLLEQERDNIFTQSLANIRPGELIKVVIRYTDSLKFEGGDYEFIFPMVVGPRYVPGITIGDERMGGGTAIAPLTHNQDTDLVPDASRLNAPILPAGNRSSHDISVTVTIDAGMPVQRVVSPSHQLQVVSEGQTVRVQLAGADTIPNKDLILRYQIAGSKTQATLLTQADERGGHFALYLIPAMQYQPDALVPKDVVFLIDTSGSQNGDPLVKCQELMRRFIKGLNPDDTFSIIDFSDTTRQLSPVPLPNTPQNQARALHYINQLQAGGGTEMLRGIQTVLNFPVVQPGRLRSIVLLTDGYIGNENQILAALQQRLQPGNRLYSFGAGSSVNRFLLNRIAEFGRGISRIVWHDEPTAAVAEQFFRQINNPVLTNLHLRWEGAGETPIMHPSTPPDLFAEQPLVILGRKADRLAGKLHVTGIAAGGDRYQQTFHLQFEATGQPAIAQLWGRARIKDLTNQMMSGDTKAGVEAVTHTALAYQLLSPYTAFVAVSDEARVNPQRQAISVQVPVEMPEGVSYAGVFGGTFAGPIQPSLPRSAMLAPAAPVSPGQFSAPSVAQPVNQKRSQEADGRMGGGGYQPGSKRRAEFQRRQDNGHPFPKGNDRSLISPSSIPNPDADIDAELESLKQDMAAERLEMSSISEPVEASGSGFVAPTGGGRLEILSITGLAQRECNLLAQRLQSLQLLTDVGGELVFEFQVANGRINQLVLDAQTSTLSDNTMIEDIRRSLLSWQLERSINSTVRLALRLQSA
jgi:Ca-activated chloride channel family protein